MKRAVEGAVLAWHLARLAGLVASTWRPGCRVAADLVQLAGPPRRRDPREDGWCW